jgi:methyl-accepting chemotaxis protein
VAQTIGERAASTHTQSRDIGQINTAVSHLEQMTQQNSALVEESAAASDGLRHQSQDLAGLISQFMLPYPADTEQVSPARLPMLAHKA